MERLSSSQPGDEAFAISPTRGGLHIPACAPLSKAQPSPVTVTETDECDVSKSLLALDPPFLHSKTADSSATSSQLSPAPYVAKARRSEKARKV